MRSPWSCLAAVAAGFVLVTGVARAGDPTTDLMESMRKLSTLKSYKVRDSFSFGGQMSAQMEMLKSMGLGDILPKGGTQEVVNPDLRRTTVPQRIPSRKGVMGAMQMIEANLIIVVKAPPGAPPKAATFIDCEECERNQDQAVDEELERQASQSSASLIHEVVNAVAGGPSGIAAAITEIAGSRVQNRLAHAENERGKQKISLNRWKCRDTGDAAEPPRTGNEKPPFHDVKYLGEQSVGGEKAKVYQFSVDDENTGQSYPMTFYSSAATGLPMKMELQVDVGQGMTGGMTMEYYDFDVPIQIDVPDCLK